MSVPVTLANSLPMLCLFPQRILLTTALKHQGTPSPRPLDDWLTFVAVVFRGELYYVACRKYHSLDDFCRTSPYGSSPSSGNISGIHTACSVSHPASIPLEMRTPPLRGPTHKYYTQPAVDFIFGSCFRRCRQNHWQLCWYLLLQL